MSVVSSFFQVRVVELSVLRVHSSVTVLPIFSITTRGFVIEIAVLKIIFDNIIGIMQIFYVGSVKVII